jgi:hypothetical protein
MKMPSDKILIDWYHRLLDELLESKIIESFTGCEKYLDNQNWEIFENIPYFYGDLWIVRLEDAIKDAELSATKKLKKSPDSQVNMQEEIWDFMRVQIEGFDKSYFVLDLGNDDNKGAKPIKSTQKIEWLNNRYNLLDFLQLFRLQFCSVRDAQFSTKKMLFLMLLRMKVCRKCQRNCLKELDVSV